MSIKEQRNDKIRTDFLNLVYGQDISNVLKWMPEAIIKRAVFCAERAKGRSCQAIGLKYGVNHVTVWKSCLKCAEMGENSILSIKNDR